MEVSKEDKYRTQEHLVFDILIKYCNEYLTPSKIEEMRDDFVKEIRKGNCKWAFE